MSFIFYRKQLYARVLILRVPIKNESRTCNDIAVDMYDNPN